jgi:threonine dehydrogenase-like Zn-dependent dehydrogenase
VALAGFVGCRMRNKQLYTQCETTQVHEKGMGAALFGYSELYGQVPGGQAELLRVPQAQFTHIKVPEGQPDSRFIYLPDVLPTAWQAAAYADIPDGGTVAILGLGAIGDMAARIADHLGHRVIAVNLVPEGRLDCPIGDAIRDLTDGRGPDTVIDAVGMEAHGSPAAQLAQQATGLLPDAIGKRLMRTAGVDRLAALHSAVDIVRRGGTISLAGVYGGMADPFPMMVAFDKQVTLRMGQANVKRWVDDIMPLLTDDDPLGVDTFAMHVLPLNQAPHSYEIFQK